MTLPRSTLPTLLLALALPLAAAGQELSGASATRRGLDATRGLSPSGMRDARSPAVELRRFEARRRAEAGLRLLDTSRDASRRAAEAGLRRSGSAADVARHVAAAQREEQLDRLRLSAAASGPERRAWLESLGPVTRRVLADSAVELRYARRRAELRQRAAELEDAVEQRPEGPPFW